MQILHTRFLYFFTQVFLALPAPLFVLTQLVRGWQMLCRPLAAGWSAQRWSFLGQHSDLLFEADPSAIESRKGILLSRNVVILLRA